MNQQDIAAEQLLSPEGSLDASNEKVSDIPADPETAIKHADQQVADLSSEGASMLTSVSSETDVAIDAETQAEMEAIKTEADQAVEALKGDLEDNVASPELTSSTEALKRVSELELRLNKFMKEDGELDSSLLESFPDEKAALLELWISTADVVDQIQDPQALENVLDSIQNKQFRGELTEGATKNLAKTDPEVALRILNKFRKENASEDDLDKAQDDDAEKFYREIFYKAQYERIMQELRSDPVTAANEFAAIKRQGQDIGVDVTWDERKFVEGLKRNFGERLANGEDGMGFYQALEDGAPGIHDIAEELVGAKFQKREGTYTERKAAVLAELRESNPELLLKKSVGYYDAMNWSSDERLQLLKEVIQRGDKSSFIAEVDLADLPKDSLPEIKEVVLDAYSKYRPDKLAKIAELRKERDELIAEDPIKLFRFGRSLDHFDDDQKVALVDCIAQVSPLDVFKKREDLPVSQEQRSAAFDRAMQQSPEALVETVLSLGRGALLTPEQGGIITGRLIQNNPALLLAENSINTLRPSKEQLLEALDKTITSKPETVFASVDHLSLTGEEKEGLMRRIIIESKTVDSALLVNLIARFSDVVPNLVKEGAEIPHDKMLTLVKGLSNRFTYSFEDDPSHALNAHTQNQLAASTLLEKLSEEELQSVLPDLIEHASDVDFGDRSRISGLLSRVKDPILRDELERKSIKPEALEDRVALFQQELAIRSVQNRQKTYDALVVTHGEEKVNEVIAQVEESMFFSVNFPPEALQKILEAGRLRSTWETKTRDSVTYPVKRHAVERNLGIRAKGTEKDPHPIYGALGYADGQDEVKGVAPGYGSAFLKLKPESVRERGAFTYGDSFHGETSSRQFSPADAAVARTKIVLDGKENYVELQLLGGATLEDIESINIPLGAVKDGMINGNSIESLREKYPNIIFNTL